MKKLVKIVLLLAFAIMSVMLISCNDEPVYYVDSDTDDVPGVSDDFGVTDVPVEPVCVSARIGYIEHIYNDMFFYKTNLDGLVRYYDLNDLEAGSYAVNTDPLIKEEMKEWGLGANPAHADLYVVSPEMTAKSGGIPVIVTYAHYIDDFYRFSVYESGINKVTRIKEDAESNVQSIHLYGDTLVYTMLNEKGGQNIFRIDLDGENFVEKKSRKSEMYYVSTIYEDRIYYVEEKSRKLYSNSLMLDDEQFLFSASSAVFNPFIADGYIMYGVLSDKKVEFDGWSNNTVELHRRPLDDLSKDEVFMEDLYTVSYANGKLYYKTYDPHHVTDRIIEWGSPYYEYSFGTGETRQLYDLTGTKKMRSLVTVGENFIIFGQTDYSTGDTHQTSTSVKIVHNLKTGEEYELPYSEDGEFIWK